MSLADAKSLFVNVCADIGLEYAAAKSQLTTKAAVEASLANLEAGDPAKAQILAAIRSDRLGYGAMAKRWEQKLDVAFGYWGTQLTVPSQFVRGNLPINRARLLDDIRAQMVDDGDSIGLREVTYDAEPAADDNGILDRLTEDENGAQITAGLHDQFLDVEVSAVPSQYAAEITIKPRNKGIDIFNLVGPEGQLTLKAVNDVHAGDGIVRNPNLQNTNSVTNDADITSVSDWTLTGSATHKFDTAIKFRGLIGSHKLYGNGNARKFEQPLIVASAHRRRARNHKVAVYKTGTPVGTLVMTWGGCTQTWNLADLGAGWNFLRPTRDKLLYPKNFAAPGAKLSVEVAFTSGSDANNRINLCFFGGQLYSRFDGPHYGYWSTNGLAEVGPAWTLEDEMSADGLNASALYLGYHGTRDRQDAYLPEDASPTIADYS